MSQTLKSFGRFKRPIFWERPQSIFFGVQTRMTAVVFISLLTRTAMLGIAFLTKIRSNCVSGTPSPSWASTWRTWPTSSWPTAAPRATSTTSPPPHRISVTETSGTLLCVLISNLKTKLGPWGQLEAKMSSGSLNLHRCSSTRLPCFVKFFCVCCKGLLRH